MKHGSHGHKVAKMISHFHGKSEHHAHHPEDGHPVHPGTPGMPKRHHMLKGGHEKAMTR